MTAGAMLELKQLVSRLSKSELRQLGAYMIYLRRDTPRRRIVRVKMQRDPATGLPYFAPPQGTPSLTLPKVKRALRDSA